MQRVAAEEGIILPEFNFLRLQFLVAAGEITRGRLAFLARFRAFESDEFARHKITPFPWPAFPRLLLLPRPRWPRPSQPNPARPGDVAAKGRPFRVAPGLRP